MTFRTIDEHLVSVCITQSHCLDCPLRTGCPVRWFFYQVNTSMFQQILITNGVKIRIPENKLKELTLGLKYKRTVELINNPVYRY